jgi:hypothetical protein
MLKVQDTGGSPWIGTTEKEVREAEDRHMGLTSSGYETPVVMSWKLLNIYIVCLNIMYVYDGAVS